VFRKLAAISIVLWQFARWLNYFIPWANERHYMGSWTWINVAVMILAAVLSSIIILLISTENILRIMRNTFVILAFTFAGWICGDPMTLGSYDHDGGLESSYGWLVGGACGAVVGYGITVTLSSEER